MDEHGYPEKYLRGAHEQRGLRRCLRAIVAAQAHRGSAEGDY